MSDTVCPEGDRLLGDRQVQAVREMVERASMPARERRERLYEARRYQRELGVTWRVACAMAGLP